jgi:hypothetical protein
MTDEVQRINGNNLCPQCREREISVKVTYANGMVVLCCNECARQAEQVEESRERVQ